MGLAIVWSMVFRKNNAVVIAFLLAMAALICLGVGLRLLMVSRHEVAAIGSESSFPLVPALAIVGGVLIFLLGTIVLLAARRLAVGPVPNPEPLPENLNLLDIQAWGRELEDIRDHLRHDLGPASGSEEIILREIVVPDSWRPEGQYLLRPDGRSADSLAELKRTRDYLMEAATRVDVIVQNINEYVLTKDIPSSYNTPHKHRGFWRLFRRG